MVKEFKNLKEIEKYYDEETNTYVFKENYEYIDLVVFKFNLEVQANIKAGNINARDIRAWDINADDIRAWDIEANNIIYYAVCYAYNNIKCKTIEGIRENAKHFVLDGTIEIKYE